MLRCLVITLLASLFAPTPWRRRKRRRMRTSQCWHASEISVLLSSQIVRWICLPHKTWLVRFV